MNWKPGALIGIGCLLLGLAMSLPHLLPVPDMVRGLLYGLAKVAVARRFR